MKTNLIAVLIAAGWMVVSPQALANHEGHPHPADTQETVDVMKPGAMEIGETIQVKANGVVCDFCARALEKVFMKRPEVAGLSIDLTTKVVTIRLKKGQSLDDETIRELVRDAGYDTIERPERLS